MQSESSWKKEKSFLEEEASNISILKKQIVSNVLQQTKEAEIDVSVQSSINDKVENLKQGATFLAKKLENQKHKNIELQMIIKHMRGKMEQQRLDASSSRGNLNSDDIIGLQNRFKKLQYDLSQINGKVNRMSENLEQKKSKISQNRTERVIDSGIFRNLEKELINSELTFKKLLIEKIKYQKEYQKITQQYQSLKEKAETYYGRKDSDRTKTSKELIAPSQIDNETVQYKKKFLEIDVSRAKENRYTTMCKVDEELQQEEQKKVMFVKKMMIRANLENCSDLLHYFDKIEEINEKYFNQINIYADQSNQIEKYLQQSASTKKQQNKLRFSTEMPSLTKQESNLKTYKEQTESVNNLNVEINSELQELVTLFESQNFKTLLQGFDIQSTSFIEDGHVNFDKLKETLRLFDSNVSQYLREPIKAEEETKNRVNRDSKGEKLDDMINKVRKNDECLKVMKKEEFKEEYQKLLKSASQKAAGRSANKKKSFPLLKK